MIIELKTKTCLISNRRNRILLTMVSPVRTVDELILIQPKRTLALIEKCKQIKSYCLPRS